MTSKVGRPVEQTDNREKIIVAARQLFVRYDFDKVTTRKIADLAKVDAGLIRYYFGSKLGLFTAVIRETSAPVRKQFELAQQNSNESSPLNVMQTYYRIMAKYPEFPKLIFKLASLIPNTSQEKQLKAVFNEVFDGFNEENLFVHMQQQGMLKEGVDPELLRLSFVSLIVFPFLMPMSFKEKFALEVDESFLNRLAEHNFQLISSFFIHSGDKR